MADEREEIILEVNEKPAVNSTEKANDAIDRLEENSGRKLEAIGKGFEKVGQQAAKAGETIVTVSDKSKNSLERTLASIERRAAGSIPDPMQRLIAQRDLDLKRVGGDPEAVNRVTAAYEKLTQAQKKADEAGQLQKAIAASKQAERGANNFALALARVNKEAANAAAAAARHQQAENTTLLNRAVSASKQAERGAEAFERALRRVNKEAKDKALEDHEKLLRAAKKASEEATRASDQFQAALRKRNREVREGVGRIERRAEDAGAHDARQKLLLEESRALKEFGNNEQNIERIRRAFARLRAEQEKKPPSLTQQIVEAGILINLFERMASILKDVTVGTALYAARTEQLGGALHTVARANTITSGTAVTLENQIKKLGVTTQDSRQNLTRLIAAHVDYRKATELATVAQNVGRVSGEGTAKSYERLTHAIISAQPELLRQVGLNLSFEESYKRAAIALGKSAESLTEAEKIQIRLNAVLQVGSSYAGVYAQSLETVAGRLLSLERKADEARNALGGEFQAEAAATIGALEKMAEVVEDNAGSFANAIRMLALFGGGALAVSGVGGPLVTLTAALLAASGAISTLISNIDKGQKKMKDLEDSARGIDLFERDLKTDALATARGKFAEGAAIEGNKALQNAERQAIAIRDAELDANKKSAELLKNAQRDELTGLAKLKREREEALDQYGRTADAIAKINKAFDIREQTLAREEADKKRKKAADEIAAAEKSAHEQLMTAQAREYSGLAQILGQREKLLEQYGKSAQAIEDINRATQVSLEKEIRAIRQEQARELSGTVREDEQSRQRILDNQTKQFEKAHQFERETLEIVQKTADERVAAQEQVLKAERDGRIRSLQLEDALIAGQGNQQVAAKASIEQRKTAVEHEYIQKTAALHKADVDTRLARELASLEAIGEAQEAIMLNLFLLGKIGADQMDAAKEAFQSRRNAVIEEANRKIEEIERKSVADQTAIRDEATLRSTQLFVDANQRAFDQVKDAYGSLLDQLLGRSRSWADAAKAFMQAALLTPLKEAASTMFASMTVGGQAGAGSGRSSGGGLSGLFGGLFSGGLNGGGGGGVSIFGRNSITGGPGGTGGFTGPVRSLGGPAASAPAGRSGILSGLAGASGLSSLLFNSGSIALGGGAATTAAGIGGFGGTLAGIASSPLAAIGGPLLAIAGARRGGVLGTALAAGGGALGGFALGAQIGAIGGPVGALIGAGIGAAAGILVSVFRGRAEKKVIEKIESRYGIKMRDSMGKDVARQILEMAKQSYAGNIDLALGAAPVRELLELYAMSTGQKWGFAPSAPSPISLEQRGGSVFQTPSFRNGSALPSLGGSVPSVSVAAAGPTVVYVQAQFDRQGTKDVLQGEVVEVVQGNPRLIGKAALTSQQQNSGRREMAAAMQTPGLVTT